MTRFKIFLVCILHLGVLLTPAWAIELVVWKAHDHVPEMILPKLDHESPEQAVRRYLKFLNENPDMIKMMNRDRFTVDSLQIQSVKNFDVKRVEKSFDPTFLFIANHFDDLKPNDDRIANFFPVMKKKGAHPFLLPVSADGGLSAEDAQDYRRLVGDTFDVLFGMGGDDVHPKTYRQRITFAHIQDLNITRDQSEILLIQEYMQRQKGVYYGICRGAQICAVARGEQLVQDLKDEQGVTKPHKSAIHEVDLKKSDDNLIRAFVGDKDQIGIQSYHHQAVKPREGMHLDIVASADEGRNFVVEGYQFKNGLGLAFQFHPELLPEDKDNLAIMQGMVDYAAYVKKQKLLNQNCTGLIKGFINAR
ncbi:MAG: hypothetical protein COW00_06645 [Bdellovibrio sp. CG12_big_fil_rev_8_21_14_0_65_39_13]|nr:MAG: hypothetical protein COW78_15625 [Bdellovibrio sp. CG22_combo_CG10-13_8_21_14_all_39_27]PIQ60459.1 MAG: hypothetical protein COW00_06645 [Bdellovibrio sp. CG12_big_fil_rev_8_21_14_0_65_39_13]PIR33868.1 MAG: hypothetical protein COV37_14835 [Bdellovibrio sp. CG11_big_fil_rev_8_21_14_0_20_39_38]